MHMQNSNKKAIPYGLWPSPITAELLSSSSVSLQEVSVNEQTGSIYWIESRPQQNGRYSIMEHTSQGTREILPEQFSAHSTVQDIGGGSMTADKDELIIFSDDSTQNIYRLSPQTWTTELILKAEPGVRYGDYSIHPKQSNWILAIKEDHRGATPTTQAYGVHNTMVAIDASSTSEHELAAGDDFYAYPRFNHDGTRVCWIQWSHPDMPWTGSVLYVADWKHGTLHNIKEIAGRRQYESISQPRWAPGGILFFVSDRSGYWQLYTYDSATNFTEHVNFKGLEGAEFAKADWRMASSTYAILNSQTIVASCVTVGASDIVMLDASTGSQKSLGLPFLDLALSATGLFRVSHDSFVVLGSTAKASKQLVLVANVRSGAPQQTTLQTTIKTPIGPDHFSIARHLQVPRTLREGNTHVFYFAPQHPEFQGPSGAVPPGLIQLHGGPNGCTSPALDLSIQYWTSRGFAVCAVNYVGSVGFGREYREELTGQWGLFDMQDIHDAVKYLGEQGLVDSTRIGVYGGSAGGYATLSVIHMFPSMFAAAVSSYGISDIQALQADSYKFESHDVERLILSCCAKDDEEGRARIYRDRSPRFHVDKITAPLLLLQGSIDVAVPPAQSHMMASKMRDLGRTVKIIEFEGEGRGWYKARSILQAYKEAEAWWKEHLCGSSL